MENKKTIIYDKLRPAILTCCMVASLLVVSITGKCQAETLIVICNQNGAPAAMKLTELKSVMKGEKQRWNGGEKVSIALMKTSTAIGKNTAELIYNMSGDALLKYWLGQTYQGSAHAPKFFNTTSELQNYVAQNSGAIGVIDQPLGNNEIRIISIDGKTQFSLTLNQ
ncbi:MAG: hypothetical protein ABI419_06850 [Ginsengibacter sp.]